MTRRDSLGRQAATRLAISLGLLVALIAISSISIYRFALHKAALERAEELVSFYTTRLDQIQREWELRSRDLKALIESTRALEDRTTALVNLQAFMTIQSAERAFQYLIIQTEDGQKLFDFGKDLNLPAIPASANEVFGHYQHPQDKQIYRVFQQPIWLGEERGMGRFAVFFRIDNALLSQMSTPGLTLSVLHDGVVVSSSGGQIAIDRQLREMTSPDSSREVRDLPWGGEAGDPVHLLIEAPVTTLFSTTELTVVMSIIPLIDGLVLWFTVGLWLMRQAHRITELGDAVIREPLTGLFNRRYLDETLPRELSRAKREGFPLVIVMLDLDRFKSINDTYGHAGGDEVLKSLSVVLTKGARESDIICRYGGEEFVIALPRMSLKQAHGKVEGWRTEFAETVVQHGDLSINVTFSGGIAIFPDHGADVDTLLACADVAMYRSKTNGRNRITFFEASESKRT